MSISNRKLKEGTYTVKYEPKIMTKLGKIYCLFRGHKEAIIKENKYCICCWEELNR